MPKCSHCGQELEYLICYYSKDSPSYETLEYDADGGALRIAVNVPKKPERPVYECPYCGEFKLYSLEEAKEFLKNV